MKRKLTDIPGMTEADISQFENIGVTDANSLFERGSTALGREEIYTKTNIPAMTYIRYLDAASLLQIKGIAKGRLITLNILGIRTPRDLVFCRASVLIYQWKVLAKDKERYQTGGGSKTLPPSLKQVNSFIHQSRELVRKMKRKYYWAKSVKIDTERIK